MMVIAAKKSHHAHRFGSIWSRFGPQPLTDRHCNYRVHFEQDREHGPDPVDGVVDLSRMQTTIRVRWAVASFTSRVVELELRVAWFNGLAGLSQSRSKHQVIDWAVGTGHWVIGSEDILNIKIDLNHKMKLSGKGPLDKF